MKILSKILAKYRRKKMLKYLRKKSISAGIFGKPANGIGGKK